MEYTNSFEPKFGPPYCDSFKHEWQESFGIKYWYSRISKAKSEELCHLYYFGNTALSDLYFAEFHERPVTAYEAHSACILESIRFWEGSNALIVRWLNTLAININGHIKAYRLDPDSKRHAHIFHFFEDWKFYDDGDNHLLLRDESELPDGFYDGLDYSDLIPDKDHGLLGIDQIIWNRLIEVKAPPQPIKLKIAEKKRAYLRERGLSDLKRVMHTQRERQHFIEDQKRMLEAETTFILNCARR